MKVLLISLITIFVQVSIAMPKDVFDAKSCTGKKLSDSTILDLVGSKDYVSLANQARYVGEGSVRIVRLDSGAKLPMATSHYRYRNKLNSTVGKWNKSWTEQRHLTPILDISSGKLVYDFAITYKHASANDPSNGKIDCKELAGGKLICNIDKKAYSAQDWADWAPTKLKGVIKEDCLWLKATHKTKTRDYEWAYYLKFAK